MAGNVKPRPKLRLVRPVAVNKLTGAIVHEPVHPEWDQALDEAVDEIKRGVRRERNG